MCWSMVKLNVFRLQCKVVQTLVPALIRSSVLMRQSAVPGHGDISGVAGLSTMALILAGAMHLHKVHAFGVAHTREDFSG